MIIMQDTNFSFASTVTPEYICDVENEKARTQLMNNGSDIDSNSNSDIRICCSEDKK